MILFKEEEIVQALRVHGEKDLKIVRNQPTWTEEYLADININNFVQRNYREDDWEFQHTDIGDVEKEEFQIVLDYERETVFMTMSKLENIVNQAFN